MNDEVKVLSPLDSLRANWEWYCVDHSHRGHSNYCSAVRGPDGETWLEDDKCDCGFVELKGSIELLLKDQL